MSTVIAREFDRATLAYLSLLEKVTEHMPSLFDRTRLERVRKEVEELRLEALAAEIRAEYPDIEIDRDLLKMVGTEPDLPLEEEPQALAAILWELVGRVDDSD